jgi:L-cysteine S-thiosulfotransferase
MRLRAVASIVALALCAAALVVCAGAPAQERALPLERLKSGIEFMSADLRALQSDDIANPGMLWVERGAKMWNERTGGAGRSCADCHQDAAQTMRGVAAAYPKFDAARGRLFNLEGRINACRSEHQGAPPLKAESEDLLAISAYVASQSHGLPIHVSIDGPARKHFDAGRAAYYRRRGQMNLACAHCHEQNWGRHLFAETITQGHPNGYPAYRMEWQTLGSEERRLRACLSGVRAEMLPYGASEYLDLELFLAWRAHGLKIEAPAVRR